MQRKIYEVYVKIVDANGAYNTLSGYPKIFDSRLYNNDIDKMLLRARAEFYETCGTLFKREDRQLQTIILIDATGTIIEQRVIGAIPEIPDPYTEVYRYTGPGTGNQEVLATLPTRHETYYNGDTVIPASPSQMVITTEEGIFVFAGWDNSSIVIDNRDAIFTGNWSFSPTIIEEPEPEPEEPEPEPEETENNEGE